MNKKPTILYITDLYYPARSREYYKEDIFLSGQLKNEANVLLCHPSHSEPFEDRADVIVIRNSGAIAGYKKDYQAFYNRVHQNGYVTFNSFDGKADMLGKNYLLELTALGYPVIPTFKDSDNEVLRNSKKIVVKPLDGADSVGMQTLDFKLLDQIDTTGHILQPLIDFQYEVSFYYLNDRFQYALYAPKKDQRWKLQPYSASSEDLDFAQKFISWNSMAHGIQRIDAARTRDGQLLLMEIEDINPYLSLDLLDERSRTNFCEEFKQAVLKLARH